jgi:hypothetical protein
MRRLSLVLGSLLVLALAMPVSAATVDRFQLPSITMADHGCGFLVVADVTVDNEYETDIYDNAGNPSKSLVTGRVVVTYENPANGKTIVENVSGSLHIDWVKGTFFIAGRNGFFSHILAGRLDLSEFTFDGHVSNEVCTALG